MIVIKIHHQRVFLETWKKYFPTAMLIIIFDTIENILTCYNTLNSERSRNTNQL